MKFSFLKKKKKKLERERDWKTEEGGFNNAQMKMISWNVRGLGGDMRRLIVKEVIRKNKAQNYPLKKKVKEQKGKNLKPFHPLKPICCLY